MPPSRYCICVGGITADLYGTLGFNHRSVKAIAWQSVYVSFFFRILASPSSSFFFSLFESFPFIHREVTNYFAKKYSGYESPSIRVASYFFFSCILHYRITIHLSITITRRAKTIRVQPRYREDLLAIILPAYI